MLGFFPLCFLSPSAAGKRPVKAATTYVHASLRRRKCFLCEKAEKKRAGSKAAATNVNFGAKKVVHYRFGALFCIVDVYLIRPAMRCPSLTGGSGRESSFSSSLL
jgi:hypothetical protein